ncbi:MAG: ribonuclease HII, partial [Peptococcaceae bacterium]|jgi:ribonuclease HII|nr:ribonuclease HII [Peptococcaceae bacterium]
VAAAVILPPECWLAGLNDSKKVSPRERERLEVLIKERALAWGIGEAEPAEIDQYNIYQATRLAMVRAVEALPSPPDYLLLDAMTLPLPLPQEPIVKGDAKVACISAASILAKTRRDRLMVSWDERYPAYGFSRHKGYPTASHRQAVIELGPCPIHRRSFLGFVQRAKAEAARAKVADAAAAEAVDKDRRQKDK